MAATLETVCSGDPQNPGRVAPYRKGFPAALADDHSSVAPRAGRPPRQVDGHYLEGFWRGAPDPADRPIATNPSHLKLLESWMRTYEPEKLFDQEGRLIPEIKSSGAKKGFKRMSANPIANGGFGAQAPGGCQIFRDSAVEVKKPGATLAGSCPDPRQLSPRSL